MATLNQLAKEKNFHGKRRSTRVPALGSNPYRKASCVKVFTKTPRKPNSALRKVAKIKYRSIKQGKVVVKYTFAYIPGEGHNLKEHSVVLFRGGNTKDLPGFKYKLIRGKFDLKGVVSRKNARSKYGVKKS